MTTYLIHAGTGTIIDADDGVYILDSENLTEEQTAVLESGDDTEIVALATELNKRFQMTDLTWANCIAYSPSSIRTEIRESLWEVYSEDDNDKAVLEWAEKASDDELNTVASYILSDHYIWGTFTDDLIDGLREGYRWSKEAK